MNWTYGRLQELINDMESGGAGTAMNATTAGLVLGVLGILVTLLIFLGQLYAAKKDKEIQDSQVVILRTLETALAALPDELKAREGARAEATTFEAALGDDPKPESSETEESVDSVVERPTRADEPFHVEEFKAAIREKDQRAKVENLRWARKVAADGGRGNLGWFADDPDDPTGPRWFVHRGRTVHVRPAIPRALRQAWEKESGKPATHIRFDYRTGTGRGNHAWYVEDDQGDTWRVTVGGRGKSGNQPPTVTLVEPTARSAGS